MHGYEGTATWVAVRVSVLLLLCGCSSPSVSSISAPRGQEAFTFVVMGDGQPSGTGNQMGGRAEFLRIVKEVNLLDPDFVVLLGNLIPGGTEDRESLDEMWNAGENALASLKVPYYQVVGCRDVDSDVAQQVYLKRHGNRFPLYYSFEHKGCHFIVLDSQLQGQCGHIKSDQLSWLKEDIERHREARKTFVFVHQPLWRYEHSNWMKDVHPLLARYRVHSVYCGHWHRYTKHRDLNGVRYIVTGGAGAAGAVPELLGGFQHYCVETVRDDTVSTAVVKPGAVEDEEVVNEQLTDAYDAFAAALDPITFRSPRGATELPETIDLVVSNPFADRLTGVLSWDVTTGSPWKMPTAPIPVDLGPGRELKLTLRVPPGGSPRNMEPIEPLPVAVWNLSVGQKALWTDFRTNVVIDPWPYAGTIAQVKKAIALPEDRRVRADRKVWAAFWVPVSNPTQWQLELDMAWRLPDECRWKVEPPSRSVRLTAGEARDVRFQVFFSGEPGGLFPVPRLDSAVRLDGETVVESSSRLPVDARHLLAQDRPFARCVRAEAAPAIDGRLSDTVWRDCDVLTDFIVQGGVDRSSFPTEARLAYDEENLYACFRCREPDLSGLVTRAVKRDGEVRDDDCVEMYVDANLDRETYYHYALSATGVVCDAFMHDVSWNAEQTVEAGREEDAWTVECAIPWKSIGVEAPAPGTRIGLNVARTRAQVPREISQWSCTFERSAAPERFGELVLE